MLSLIPPDEEEMPWSEYDNGSWYRVEYITCCCPHVTLGKVGGDAAAVDDEDENGDAVVAAAADEGLLRWKNQYPLSSSISGVRHPLIS